MQRPSITRRRAIETIGGASLLALLAACSSDSTTSGSTTTDTANGQSSTTAASDDCTAIPQETAGPFPGDGTNGPDALHTDGVVRRDIRSSFGDASGTADGIPLEIVLNLRDASKGCTALAGAAVYLWHADAEGRYSMYSSGAEDENYLRGVQVSDSDGTVRFTSVMPGCYDGRWPHVHFEIYDTLEAAQASSNPRGTSQLAFPRSICEAAYADARYPTSSDNLARLSLETDNVFSDDGAAHQLATMSGSISSGLTASLTVNV